MSAKDVQPTSVSEVRPYDRFVQYLQERATVENGDWSADELTRNQVNEIITAENEDALFAAMKTAGLTGLKDVENGTVITIHGFRLIQGQLGNIGVYAVIDAVDPATGEGLSLDTGVERVIAFLRMAETMDLLPVTVTVVKKTTGSGNEMVTLARPPKRPVKGQTVS
jgi:hypothetical protein